MDRFSTYQTCTEKCSCKELDVSDKSHTMIEVLTLKSIVSRCSSSIPGHGQAILATQFSPSSSSRLVTGSGDNTARIWDCLTGTPYKTLKGHTSWVLVVSWDPTDSTIATGSMDNTVRLWDPKTGEALGNAMKGHTKWVNSLSWVGLFRLLIAEFIKKLLTVAMAC